MTETSTVSTRTSTVGLVDAVDRLLEAGVVVVGDVIIGVGDVDLIRIDLRALIAGAATDLGGGPS